MGGKQPKFGGASQEFEALSERKGSLKLLKGGGKVSELTVRFYCEKKESLGGRQETIAGTGGYKK